MSIAAVVLRGYGNGTVSGTVPLVATRGYAIGAAVIPPVVYIPTGRATTRGGDFSGATRVSGFTTKTRGGSFT